MKIIVLLFIVAHLTLSRAIVGQKGTRIIGGDEVASVIYKFVVSIIYRTSNGQYFCAGSLLSNRWVLTSGTCVDGATSLTILAGTHYRQGANQGTGTQVASSNSIINPGYSTEPLQNDIGMVQFREAVEFNDFTATASLYGNNIPDFQQVLTVGWGTTGDSDDEFQDILNSVYVTTLPNQECSLYYGDQVIDTMVCAIGKYNEGTCYGDMGGPLVYSYKAWLVVGVASFISSGGCESQYPSGFTRTYPFNDWILETMRS